VSFDPEELEDFMETIAIKSIEKYKANKKKKKKEQEAKIPKEEPNKILKDLPNPINNMINRVQDPEEGLYAGYW